MIMDTHENLMLAAVDAGPAQLFFQKATVQLGDCDVFLNETV